jgi:predicted NBD/HSP70 family sugar kinase
MEEKMKHFVGLDVSMKETAACVVDDAGQRVWEGSVPRPADAIAAIIVEKAQIWHELVWRPVLKPSGFGMPCETE